MNLNPSERADAAELLRSAKDHLWDGRGQSRGKSEFICIAILRAAGHRVDDLDYRLSSEIERRLGRAFTLEAWLYEQPGVRYEDLTYENVQAHRHAWLDMLIEEFSAT